MMFPFISTVCHAVGGMSFPCTENLVKNDAADAPPIWKCCPNVLIVGDYLIVYLFGSASLSRTKEKSDELLELLENDTPYLRVVLHSCE
jgi:hypothetical protein